MIALYAAGMEEKIRKRVRKYVSIASPHGGAQSLQTLLDIPIISFLAKKVLSYGCTAQLTCVQPSFLRNSYPQAAENVFKVVPRENMLQIWSSDDGVAPPESSLRFVKKEKMLSYKVGGKHLGIPRSRPVINKTIDFLYGEEIKEEKEFPLLFHIEADKNSGLPGDEICIASPYVKYKEDYSISVKLGNNPVESRLEDGRCIFEVPDIPPGIRPIGVTIGVPNHGNVKPKPIPFIVQPYLGGCSPSRVLQGGRIVIYGDYPPNKKISVYLDGSKIPYELSQDNKNCEITLPEIISDGKKKIKIRYDGVDSNTVEFIVCDLIFNRRTRGLHYIGCPRAQSIRPGNRVYLSSTYDKPRGNSFYNFCQQCMGFEDMLLSNSNLIQLGHQIRCPHCNKIIDVGTENKDTDNDL